MDQDLVFLMEQAPDDRIQRKRGIEKLVVLHGPAEDGDMLPLGMVHPGMKPGATFLAFGQVLKEDSAGDVTGDDQLKSEGKDDQLSAAVKDGAEDVR